MPRETKAERTAREAKEREAEVQAEIDAVADGLTDDYNETQPSPEVPEAPPSGVFVTREFLPDAKVGIEVVALGDVKITEVQFILERGLERLIQMTGQKPG